MKKFFGCVVLLCFLICGALPSIAGAFLPAPTCCRVHGEHHCADLQGGDGHAFVSSCPQRGGAFFLAAADAALENQTSLFQFTTFPFATPLQRTQAAAIVLDPSGRSPPFLLV